MNDRPMHERPVLRRQSAPDHRPGFWEELDAAMVEPTQVLPRSANRDSTREAPLRPVAPTADDASVPHVDAHPGDEIAARRRSRRTWPLVAAAAALALMGLGLLFARGSSDPGTELVSGSDGDGAAVADAPPVAGAGDSGDASDDSPTTSEAETATPSTPATGDAGARDGTETASSGATNASGSEGSLVDTSDAPEPIDLDALDVPTYVTAAGNRATMLFPPSEPFPDGTRFLASWEPRQVSWFSPLTREGADLNEDCGQPDHSTLRYARADGADFDVSDPPVRFAGNASNFTFTNDYFAWLSECAGRLMLFVGAQTTVPGNMVDVDLAWVGRGSDTAALVAWNGSVVTLNSIDDAGEPFFVAIDMQARVVSGSGARSDVGPDTGRDSWIVGATPDGVTTWWNATQATAAVSCDGQTLVRHTDAGGWESPFAEPVDVGAVQALAVNIELSMVAFSDACPGINEGRFFIGTLRADGLISSVREIDLSAFASGSVSILDWTDPLTLRIHTDESVTAGFPLRFEYVFDDGRDAGVLVLLD